MSVFFILFSVKLQKAILLYPFTIVIYCITNNKVEKVRGLFVNYKIHFKLFYERERLYHIYYRYVCGIELLMGF